MGRSKRTTNWWSKILDWLGGAVVGFVIGQVLPPLQPLLFPPAPAGVRPDPGGRAITIVDRKSAPIRTVNLDFAVGSCAFCPPPLRALAIVGELAPSGETVPSGTGRIQAHDARSGRLIWRFDTYDAGIVSSVASHGKSHSATFNVAALTHVAPLGGSRAAVVALARDPDWLTTRVVELDLKAGRLRGELWHPGHIESARPVGPTTPPVDAILITGHNNLLGDTLGLPHLNVPIVSSLRLDGQFGQAWPALFSNPLAGGPAQPLPLVKPTWYLFVLPVPSSLEIKQIMVSPVGERGWVVRLCTGDARFYDVDWRGTITGVSTGDAWGLAHDGEEVPWPVVAVAREATWQFASARWADGVRPPSRAVLALNRGIVNVLENRPDSAAVQFAQAKAQAQSSGIRRLAREWQRNVAKDLTP